MILMTRVGTAQARSEALASAAIHGLAAVLSAIGLIVLLELASKSANDWAVSSIALYGATLIFSYLIAALYHGARGRRVRELFQTFDHCAIFLLIAGTYTPFALLPLWDHLGWVMFLLVWLLACLGIGIRLFWIRRLHRLAPALYLAMGWLGLAWARPLLETLGTGALMLVVAGGVAYTAGLVFFRWRSLPYGNAVWHGFVVTGSACHFSAIAFYALPYAGTLGN